MLFSNFECIVMVANAATMLEEPTGSQQILCLVGL